MESMPFVHLGQVTDGTSQNLCPLESGCEEPWKDLVQGKRVGKKEDASGLAKETGDFPRDLRWERVDLESFWILPVRTPWEVDYWMPGGKTQSDWSCPRNPPKLSSGTHISMRHLLLPEGTHAALYLTVVTWD